MPTTEHHVRRFSLLKPAPPGFRYRIRFAPGELNGNPTVLFAEGFDEAQTVASNSGGLRPVLIMTPAKTLSWRTVSSVVYHLGLPDELRPHAASLADLCMGLLEGTERQSLSRQPFAELVPKDQLRVAREYARSSERLFHEITERRRVETELKESRALYQTIVDTVPLGITLIDTDYRVVMANAAVGRWMGRDPQHFVGKRCFLEFDRRGKCCAHCPGTAAMETGKLAEVESEAVRDDGVRIPLRITAVPVLDAGGKVKGFVEVLENLSENLREEEERRKLEEQLIHSQKMEAVGLLAGGVAHDFNNILTAIIGYANLLLMKLPRDPSLTGYVEQILTSADRAANLTRSLLAFSRKQIIIPRPLDLNEIISNIHKLLDRVIGEDIELVTSMGAGPLFVMADRVQIEQILMNLATNARDAMPVGGKLTISTEVAGIDEAFMRKHGFGKPGTYVRLQVSDTGTGMDEKTRERIFEPFFTTKEVGRGTGLGLSMVYGAVRQNNGYVNVESEPEKGTRFDIYLPLLKEGQIEKQDEEIRALRGGSETILIAEDDEALRKLIISILMEFGYRVIVAKDGIEAVNKFSETAEEIDLAILDVLMPKMDGRLVYEQMRRLKPGVKALFLSGYSADYLSSKGILGRGMNLLMKPVSPNQLLLTIRQLLDAPNSLKNGSL